MIDIVIDFFHSRVRQDEDMGRDLLRRDDNVPYSIFSCNRFIRYLPIHAKREPKGKDKDVEAGHVRAMCIKESSTSNFLSIMCPSET